MAISLVYGVAFGTMFILLFFPSLILILNDIRRELRQLWHGKKLKREEVEIAWLHAQRKIDNGNASSRDLSKAEES
jgi:predicted RND superfamily exporter protein